MSAVASNLVTFEHVAPSSGLRTIAIVGAGFSGTALAVQLLRTRTPSRLRIFLIERANEFGRGVAYAKGDFAHLLNVPASRMSADSRDPLQFVRFAKRRDPSVTSEDFLPRELYGEYLQSLLRDAERQTADHEVIRVSAEVKRIVDSNEVSRLELSNGTSLVADDVVLATGNPQPISPQFADQVRAHPAYVSSSWNLPDSRNTWRDVLIVGTGLSMVDSAIQLLNEAPRDSSLRIHAISRRGLVPLSQSARRQESVRDVLPSFGSSLNRPSLRQLTRDVRRRASESLALGEDWREIVYAIRANSPQVWSQLSAADKGRFVRHLRPYWDIYRHRLPPRVWHKLASAQKTGALLPRAGRIASLRPAGEQIEVEWHARGGGLNKLTVDAVINATGPNYALQSSSNRLLRSLVEEGTISADPASLGIRTDDFGRVIGADNESREHLYYVGPMLRADYWEATAVAELRRHVEQLAATLLKSSKVRSIA